MKESINLIQNALCKNNETLGRLSNEQDMLLNALNENTIRKNNLLNENIRLQSELNEIHQNLQEKFQSSKLCRDDRPQTNRDSKSPLGFEEINYNGTSFKGGEEYSHKPTY